MWPQTPVPLEYSQPGNLLLRRLARPSPKSLSSLTHPSPTYSSAGRSASGQGQAGQCQGRGAPAAPAGRIWSGAGSRDQPGALTWLSLS